MEKAEFSTGVETISVNEPNTGSALNRTLGVAKTEHVTEHIRLTLWLLGVVISILLFCTVSVYFPVVDFLIRLWYN